MMTILKEQEIEKKKKYFFFPCEKKKRTWMDFLSDYLTGIKKKFKYFIQSFYEDAFNTKVINYREGLTFISIFYYIYLGDDV